MKIVIVDIDGVLNNYPQTFINFVNNKLNSNFILLKEIKETLPFNIYKQLKEEYRKSPYKHNCSIKKDADKLLKVLREKDYLIYLVTSRKLFENNQLELTIRWLKKNNLIYDYLYCTQKKDFTIFEKFKNIKLLIEDNNDNIKKIMKINHNIKSFLVLNNDNLNYDCEAIKVKELGKIIYELENE